MSDRGEKTSVVISLKEWKEINDNYQKLIKKVEVFTGIAEAIKEIKLARKGGKKLQLLKDFLN